MTTINIRGPKDWGYAIYRTVYTPESDALWPSIMTKLESYIHRSIWYQLHLDRTITPTSFNYTTASPESIYVKNIVFSDPAKYSNQTIDDIANHFTDFLDATPLRQRSGISERVCLIIDEEVLWWLRDDPGPPVPNDWSPRKEVFVKAVDADWDPEESDEIDGRFKGWALVPVGLLQFLHGDLSGDFTLGGLVSAIPGSYDGRVFKYKG